MLLELRKLSITIDSCRIVQDASFTVPEGSITALIGESGSGKTLTAMAVSGLLRKNAAVSGSILLDGKPIDAASLGSLRGRTIATVFQDAASALNPVYTIEKQLRRADRNADVSAMLSSFGLAGKGRCYPFELSGGMQMRAEIMIASALSPRLLIADEITASLDERTASSIMDLIVSGKEKDSAVLIITHDISIARKYAENIVVMHAGESVEHGKKDDVLDHPLHPYTQALLRCSRLEKADGRFYAIERPMPHPSERGSTCTYRNRCSKECSAEHSWIDINGHFVKCLHPLSFSAK